MEITYNNTAKRFVIRCSFLENKLIENLPARRFHKRSASWYAPTLARNAEFLLTNLREHMSPEAIKVAEEKSARKQIRRERFPSWYPFKTTPFAKQKEALDYIWGLDEFALFMEMGTGKSKIYIDYFSARMMSSDINVAVIFCKASLIENWVEQIEIHCPLSDVPVFRADGFTTQKKLDKFIGGTRAAERAWIIAGIESMQSKYQDGRTYHAILGSVVDRKYDVGIDESHLVKGYDSNRSRNVEFLSQAALSRGIGTGTPLDSQGVLDLYMQFQILNPDILGIGSFYGYRNRYAEYGGYENKEVVGYKNTDELFDLLRPYVFECRKSEVVDLPEKSYSYRVVNPTKEQQEIYRSVMKKVETDLSNYGVRGQHKMEHDNVLMRYNLAQQIAGGFVYYDEVREVREFDGDEFCDTVRRTHWIIPPERNPKIIELLDVAESRSSSKIIIWAKFRNEIAMIVEALSNLYGEDSVQQYHGGFSKSDNRKHLNLFKHSDSSRFFVSTQSAAGTGETIIESDTTVYYSNSLKLIDRLQSEDRNHRIGQKNPVLYVDLLCKGTKDEGIHEAIKAKKDILDYVREGVR